MRIPTHQIHNVLNAYARRLAESCKQENDGKPDGHDRARSLFSDKRRFIIDQIIEDTLQNMINSRREHPEDSKPAAAAPDPRSDEEKNHLFHYQRMISGNRKIHSVIEITELDFMHDAEEPSPHGGSSTEK